MANRLEKVLVPDIGGATNVEVIEVFVKPGDSVAVDSALLTLEGDKATMEIPAPFEGTVKSIDMKVGDRVSEGTLILTMEVGSDASKVEDSAPAEPAQRSDAKANSSSVQDVRVPDLGGSSAVEVIEILVKPGQTIAAEDALMTLEGDKASMDIPAPFSGEVIEIHVKQGDKVSQDDLILKVKTEATVEAPAPKEKAPQAAPSNTSSEPVQPVAEAKGVHAGPAVRRLARELDLNLGEITGTGEKGRITKEDVKRYVKEGQAGSGSLTVSAAPVIDFSQFGETTTRPLSKIKKLSGANLHRNWVNIPHVTQFEEADITEMEAFRQAEKQAAAAAGVRLTPLVFIMKAVVAALKAFPEVNASLDASGEQLILKNYYHIGVAVDTPNGLVVPVIRDVDQKSLFDLAKELAEVSLTAREKGLSMAAMQGGCFTISSLGGIGGTAFTPIINAPEVAILGVSKSTTKPVYDAKTGAFVPRLMLPLSLSYDHRVIDGAAGARFAVYLATVLSDIRKLLL